MAVGLVDGGAAHHDGVRQAALVQLLHAQRHLLGGRDQQRGEADGVGPHLHRLVDDRVERHLLAQVVDGVAVVGEDRVDQVLADVVDVAVDGGQHDPALGIALLALQELLEVGDRLLHHLGRLQHERQDQLAGAEAVADVFHRREQHVVEYLDRRLARQRLVDIGLHAILLAVQDAVVDALLGASDPPAGRRPSRRWRWGRAARSSRRSGPAHRAGG